jgi:3-hydroxyisobutyrate dehydrogenase-like beta-hydroxyacid dehydrogenase
MGTAMARRLLQEGHEIGVHNRTAAKAEALAPDGARVAATVAEAATFGNVTITMLENDDALRAVALGDGGIVASLPAGAIHVAMGTHGLETVRAVAEAHRARGQAFVGAPVLGRPPAAEQGQLGIIAAGAPESVAACAPLFSSMGRRTFVAGEDPASAAAAKIANNLLLACAIEAMGEAFALAEKCDVALGVFYEVITDGLFAAPAYRIYGKMIAEKAYFGAPGFTARIGLKDLNLALAAGDAAAVPLPSGNVPRDRLLSAIANGHGERDWTAMALEQARASGLDTGEER